MTYDAGGPPYISLRIQELFGVPDAQDCNGTCAVSVHILAPSMRPVQVTRTLRISGVNITLELSLN